MNGRHWVSAASIACKASCICCAKKTYSPHRTPSSAASKSVSSTRKIPSGASSSWSKWCRMRNRSIENSGARAAKHKGLTLVELLVAIAQLQSDCAHLVGPSALRNRVPLAAGQGRLTLVRTVFADNQPSRLQVIAYRVRDGVLIRRESAATRDLRELDSLWLIAENDLDTSQAVVLKSDVTALTMRLWVSGGNGWQTDIDVLTPTAGSTASPPLPTRLEVTMQLRGRDTGMLKIFLLGAV